jgi:hypothetical protein
MTNLPLGTLLENRIVRIFSAMACGLIVFNLFYIGSKPVAVGLFQPPMDKVVHFLTFSMITLLLRLALIRLRPYWLFGTVFLIGALDEIHQIFLPGRSAGLDDLAADTAAAMLTTLLLIWLERKAAHIE